MQWLGVIIDYGILGLLGLMSFVSVAIAAERALFYRNIRIESFSDKRQLEIE
ncbi:secreted protein, partial [Candidatus Magnetobacterium bavaricum]